MYLLLWALCVLRFLDALLFYFYCLLFGIEILVVTLLAVVVFVKYVLSSSKTKGNRNVAGDCSVTGVCMFVSEAGKPLVLADSTKVMRFRLEPSPIRLQLTTQNLTADQGQ